MGREKLYPPSRPLRPRPLSESYIVNRYLLSRLFIDFVLVTTILLAVPARAADEAADAFIKHLSSEMLNSIKTDHASQVCNVPAIIALVDAKRMPSVNFKRMTSSAVGPAWRQMTPEQQKRLQEEFKILLLRTYVGALSQIGDVTIAVKPLWVFRPLCIEPDYV